MPAGARNQAKSRVQRLGETLTHNHLKSGQADSQVIVQGCDLAVGNPTTTYTLNAGEALLAQALLVVAAKANQAVPAGAATAAGRFRKVLVLVDAANALSTKIGADAGTQAEAPLPADDPDKIAVGYIELPAAFVPGTTAVTGAMLKKVPYHA